MEKISPELMLMIEQVAEKAAERAALRVAEQAAAERKIDLLELESKIKKAFSEEIDKKLKTGLAMSPAEHAVDHAEFKQVLSLVKGIKSAMWQRIINVAVVGALVFLGGTFAKSELTEQPAQAIVQEIVGG